MKIFEGVWAYQVEEWLVTVLLLLSQKAYLAVMFVALYTNANNMDIKGCPITRCL
jgi:hypothetical protein